jgi:hypothetical protein
MTKHVQTIVFCLYIAGSLSFLAGSVLSLLSLLGKDRP